MKSFVTLFFICAFILSFGLPPTVRANATPAKETEAAPNKKNITVTVLKAKPEAVHVAALQALAAVGCDVKKDSPMAIEGKRSNKIGLAVGSGGEKIFVNLKDLGGEKTELTVTTKKTILGIAGQKYWNDEVATRIRNALP